MMYFFVFDASGALIYHGGSWPMARAALDFAIMKNDGCPALTITPQAEV